MKRMKILGVANGLSIEQTQMVGIKIGREKLWEFHHKGVQKY